MLDDQVDDYAAYLKPEALYMCARRVFKCDWDRIWMPLGFEDFLISSLWKNSRKNFFIELGRLGNFIKEILALTDEVRN